MKRSTTSLLIGLAFLVAIASFVYKKREYLGAFFGFSQQDQKKDMEPVTVEAGPVTVKPFVKELISVGKLVAHDSVIIRPEIEGIISGILFDSGDYVKKGKTLYTLDDGLARAQLTEANAELLVAEKNYERAKALSKEKFVSGKDVDELFAKWEKAKAQVELAKVKLSKTVLQAPFEGYTGIVQHSKGAFVKTGEDLVTVVALDPIKVDFHVGEEHLQSLEVGQNFTLKVDGFSQEFKGEVEATEPNIDVSGHSILVRGRVENHGAKLHPGLFATITLVLNVEEEAIFIPESALETQGSDQFVYRVVDGVAVQTPVTAGEFENGMVHILDGLWTYDNIVTAGSMKISDGVPIRVVKGPGEMVPGSMLSAQQIENAKAIFRGEKDGLSENVEDAVVEGEEALTQSPDKGTEPPLEVSKNLEESEKESKAEIAGSSATSQSSNAQESDQAKKAGA